MTTRRTFAWCEQGFHADYEGEWSAPCHGEYTRVVKSTSKRGKKSVEVVESEEKVTCECPCHSGEPVAPTKPKKKRRKK